MPKELPVMTWFEAKTFLDKLLIKLLPLPTWLRAAGLGFDIRDNSYNLKIRVANEEGATLTRYALTAIGYTGAYDIEIRSVS